MEERLIKLQATLDVILENQAIIIGFFDEAPTDKQMNLRKRYMDFHGERIAQKVTELKNQR